MNDKIKELKKQIEEIKSRFSFSFDAYVENKIKEKSELPMTEIEKYMASVTAQGNKAKYIDVVIVFRLSNLLMPRK